VGPQLTRLAGEIADGWIAHELGSPAYLREKILPNLEQGWRQGGRDRDGFTIVVSACCVPHADAREAKRRAAGLVAFYATVKTYDDFFDYHGFLPEAKEVQRRFRAGEQDSLADAVPDDMVDALAFAGTPDDIRERLGEYAGLADVVKLSPPTHFVPEEVTRDAQQAVIEMFAT
jgi:alkanesulfonate monooxygenase SsuD/methylene tetrahydromethanopterin reductase-like flavin-dependent oxidoreductase (luciferase family)